MKPRDEISPPVAEPGAPERRSRAHSTLVTGNITVDGRRTSIRLEPSMWRALEELCRREGKPLDAMVSEIARRRSESRLTAEIRVYLLQYFRAAATEEGHRQAGHGGVTPRLRQ